LNKQSRDNKNEDMTDEKEQQERRSPSGSSRRRPVRADASSGRGGTGQQRKQAPVSNEKPVNSRRQVPGYACCLVVLV
jgi:hypothetical protein